MTSTDSAMRSTSSRMCEESSTVRPCSAIVRSSSNMCSRWRGSMPLKGSSRTSTGRVVHQCGGHLDALAHALGVGADASVGGLVEVHQRDGRGRGSRRVGQALQLGVGHRRTRAGQERIDRLTLGHQPDAAVHARVPPGLPRPARARLPADGASSPAIMCSSVVLPAPLGPSRPGHARGRPRS